MLTLLMMLKTTKLGLKSLKKWFLKTGTGSKVESILKIVSRIQLKKFVFRVESDHGIFKSF